MLTSRDSSTQAVGDVERLRELMELPGWRTLIRAAKESVRQSRTSLLTTATLSRESVAENVGRVQGVYQLLRLLYHEANQEPPSEISEYFTGVTP